MGPSSKSASSMSSPTSSRTPLPFDGAVAGDRLAPPPLPRPRPPRRRGFLGVAAVVVGVSARTLGAPAASAAGGGAGRVSPILGRYGTVAAAAASGDGLPSRGGSGNSNGSASSAEVASFVVAVAVTAGFGRLR